MTAKTVNYTAEQTAKMIADYQSGFSVETIAENLGKPRCDGSFVQDFSIRVAHSRHRRSEQAIHELPVGTIQP
jgi:hypothetical protein